MRVLAACEFSGRVRDAFRSRGHDAWSCDLLPSEAPGPHIQGNVLYHLDEDWDLVIAFPPCTYLCPSGIHWNTRRPERRKLTKKALDFVFYLWKAPVDRLCIENPVGILSTKFERPSQFIHPWQFGHPEAKRTCLWLRGLPRLAPTNVLPLPESGRWDNQTPSGQNKMGPSPDRWKRRSLTYQGIADAMAEQWGA